MFFQGKQGNFAKGALKSTDPLEASYDFKSLMHYGKGSFSVSGKDTIEVIGDPDQRIGYRDGLSTTDIEQLNALYDCSNPGKRGSNYKFILLVYHKSNSLLNKLIARL